MLMADEATKKSKLEVVSPVTPKDADDIEALFLDPALGDGLTDQVYHSIPTGKPKAFFRVCPLAGYRRRTELYVHKVEGQIEEQSYIVAPRCEGRSRKPAASPW